MAVPLAVFCSGNPAVEPAALADIPGTAGSLVLCRMDRRGHKSGTGSPLRQGLF